MTRSRLFTRKRILIWSSILLFVVVLYLLRFSILQGFGDYLITEDELQEAEVAFVLGGNSIDRGKRAAEIYEKGFAKQLVCVGNNIPGVLRTIGEPRTEGEITSAVLLQEGVPEGRVETVKIGTSTMEEARAILEYCQEKGYEKAIVISDKFHLRRVRMVFAPLFEEADLELILIGAESSVYDESQWWKSEEGLIMVNNEYIKLGFYWWVY